MKMNCYLCSLKDNILDSLCLFQKDYKLVFNFLHKVLIFKQEIYE